jgi:hypothetical protein
MTYLCDVNCNLVNRFGAIHNFKTIRLGSQEIILQQLESLIIRRITKEFR